MRDRQKWVSKEMTMHVTTKFRLRVYRDEVVAIGPGKIELLEAVRDVGSISGAARHIGMSYRRAWLLLDELNKSLTSPATQASTGGAHGGGARLTPVGEEIIARYRAIEEKAYAAGAQDLEALQRMLAA